MDYFIKQATLHKLAFLRLAINYVLRGRMAKYATEMSTGINNTPQTDMVSPTAQNIPAPTPIKPITGFRGRGATKRIFNKIAPSITLENPVNTPLNIQSDIIPSPTFEGDDPFDEYFNSTDVSNVPVQNSSTPVSQ